MLTLTMVMKRVAAFSKICWRIKPGHFSCGGKYWGGLSRKPVNGNQDGALFLEYAGMPDASLRPKIFDSWGTMARRLQRLTVNHDQIKGGR